MSTKSTSPKPKKRRQLIRDIQDEMEVDVEDVTYEDIEGHDIWLVRSKEQDEKVRKREVNLNEKEERYKEKKRIEKEKREEDSIKNQKMKKKNKIK